MTRYKIENGLKIPLTLEEEAVFDARKAKYDKEKPMMQWKEAIQTIDSYMPRFLEDLITDNPSLTIHEKMKTRYDEKVALRATQPKE